MEEGAGSLGVVQQKATVQRSSSNQSGTQNHAGIKINNRTGIHALVASTTIHASAGSVSDRVQDTTFHKSQAKGLGREIGMKLGAFAQAIIQEQVATLRQLVILQYQLVDV